jgi:hypothetical protein
LGIEHIERGQTLAVLKCQGTFEFSPPKLSYQGIESCEFAHSLYGGESGCAYGCLHLGDCADVYNVIEDRKVYMPLGTTANKQGRVAGIYIAGYKQEKFSGIVGTQIAKAFGFEFARVGIDERIAKEISMNIDVISTKYHTKSSYMINNKNAYVKLYVDKKNGVIVGGQIVGEEGTARRIDILASAIFSHMSIKDFAYLDISYAPLFSPVWDPLLVSAQKSIKRGQR